MTLQEKRNYLAKYRSLNRRMARSDEEINQLHSLSEKVTTTLSRMPKSKAESDRIQSAVEKITELEEQLITDFERCGETRNKIFEAINSVENDKYRELLIMRYIDGKTFEHIAFALDYSWRHVHRVHSNALLQIKI